MSKKSFPVTEPVEVTFENLAIVTSTSSATVLFGHPPILFSAEGFRMLT